MTHQPVASHAAELLLPGRSIPQPMATFPGNPIIPGAVLLREVVRVALGRCRGNLLRDPLGAGSSIRSARVTA